MVTINPDPGGGFKEVKEEKMEVKEEVTKLKCDREQDTPPEKPAEHPALDPDHSLNTIMGQTTQDSPTQQTPPTPVSSPDSSLDNPHTSTEDTQKPEIVLLVDSNGKYVQEGTLFP